MGLEGTGTLFSAAGSGVEAYGAYSAGVAKKESYDMTAEETELAGEMKLAEIEAGGEELASTQRAMYAKAGVRESGSVLDVMLESAINVEFDKIIAKWNIDTQANMLRLQGKTAKNTGIFNAGQSVEKMGLSLLSSNSGKVPTADPRGTAGGYAAYQGSQ